MLRLRIVVLFSLGMALWLCPVYGRSQNAPAASPRPHPEVDAILSKGEQAAKKYHWNEALRFYKEALTKARSLEDRAGQAYTMLNIGVVYDETSQPKNALEYYENALSLFDQTGDRHGEARALNNIGLVYSDTRQNGRALEYLEKALLLYRESGDRRGEGTAYNNMGLAYFQMNQADKALEYHEKALLLFRQVSYIRGEAAALKNMGGIYRNIGQPAKALEYLEKALPLYREAGNVRGEAAALNSSGGAYQDLGQLDKALEYFKKALPLYQKVGNRRAEASALHNLGNVYGMIAKPDEAIQYYEQALTLYEKYRDEIGIQAESKMAFLESVLDFYQHCIVLLLEQKRGREAFQWTQKVKARVLLDLMQSGKVSLRGRLSPEETAQERALYDRVAETNRLLIRETNKEQAAMHRQKLQEAERALQMFMDRLYARHPELAKQRAVRTVTLEEAARHLSEEAALLEYVLVHRHEGGVRTDKIVLFCLTHRGDRPVLATHTVVEPLPEIAQRIESLRADCVREKPGFASKATALYRSLIAPVEKQIAGKKRLIICPDGVLWNLPFQALLSGASGQEKYVIERFELSYAYSATAAQAAAALRNSPQRPHATATLLAMANPDFGALTTAKAVSDGGRPLDYPSRSLTPGERGGIIPLPGTQKEAEAIAKLFPQAVVRVKGAAQEATFKKECGKYRYLHLATHGLFNDAVALMSSVVLAQPGNPSNEDGFLTAREIFDLNLSAEMVVLSACDTALGEKRPGEGLIGLMWSLFAAGAPSQVLSQWKVNDASTALLMKTFYTGIIAKQPKSRALQGAMNALLRDPRYRHPHYWAPFILTGNWQ